MRRMVQIETSGNVHNMLRAVVRTGMGWPDAGMRGNEGAVDFM